MALYKKKPIVVEAIQLREPEKFEEGTTKIFDFPIRYSLMGKKYFTILQFDQSSTIVEEGDWIIKGVKGEFYSCKDDIFRLTYEKVE